MMPTIARFIGHPPAQWHDWRPWNSSARHPSPPMILNSHFREFAGLLEKHRVEFLVVGGYRLESINDMMLPLALLSLKHV